MGLLYLDLLCVSTHNVHTQRGGQHNFSYLHFILFTASLKKTNVGRNMYEEQHIFTEPLSVIFNIYP